MTEDLLVSGFRPVRGKVLTKGTTMPSPKYTMKRGALPSPRHELAAAVPHVALLKVPPTQLYHPKKLSMWHNDVHGDCVTAEEAFAKACHHPEIFITDAEVQAWATEHGWFDGATLIEVLKAMQQHGFVQSGHTYDDGVPHSVNWMDDATVRSAIYHGPVKIGVAANQLETACQATNFKDGWFGTGFQKDDNEDHCVSLCGYGTLGWLAEQLKVSVPANVNPGSAGYAVFTWGCIGIMDIPSMQAITREAWLRVPTTVAV
jgi:hypothetical protein